ncbi:hypothetical protein [Shewanella algae]|uniref:hypothetical protein n=1 Tax=Shewanella algae TaxID=38313 RepID=UPI001AAC5C82|nr:hypothetical protein [Shewanella algae]MBO2701055.1 hypothetical protein [Shewanella algae]
MSSNLKLNDEMICVHTIEGKREEGHEIPVPDMRANKPFGIHDQEDDQTAFFQKLIYAKFDQTKIGIAAPNEISLSLSISTKSKNNAHILRESIKNNGKKSDYSLFDKDVKSAYDFLEEIQKAIVFGYKAVESFCNASIPDEYIYQKRNGKGVIEHYGKEQIERWINTSEKVSSILPSVLDVESPTSEGFWSDFKNLERLRNEIIHSKSSSTSDILSELFSMKIDDYLLSCLLLLEFFISKDPYNQIFPLGFGVSQIKVMSVPNADEILSKIE